MQGELDRIADQIGQNLLESKRVYQYIGRMGFRVEYQAEREVFLSGQTIKHPDHGIGQIAQVDPLR